MIAERDGVVLRHATAADLPAIDHLTAVGYAPIQESFVAMLGADLYETVQADPGQTWEQRKAQQNRRLFAEHPEQVWVLEDTGWVFGYVTFWLVPARSYGHLDNSAVDPACRGEGCHSRGPRFHHRRRTCRDDRGEQERHPDRLRNTRGDSDRRGR